MALTFSDWTHYTDDGGTARTLDWAAPVLGAPILRPYGEALRQANMLEREYVRTGTKIDTPFAAQFPTRSGSAGLTSSMLNQYNHFPSWVNHEDNSGDWEAQANAAPNWTSVTMVASIGAALSLPMVQGQGLLLGGFVQPYEVLRRMLWRALPYVYENQGDYNRYSCKHGVAAQWIDGVSDWASLEALASSRFLASSWSLFHTTPWGGSYVGGFGRKVWTTAGKYVTYSRRRIRAITTAMVGDIAWAYDMYYLTRDLSTLGVDWEWDDEGQGITANTWHRFSTDPASIGITRTTNYVGNSEVTPPTPSDVDYGGDRWRGWTLDKSSDWPIGRCVSKWSVPGGFVFQGA